MYVNGTIIHFKVLHINIYSNQNRCTHIGCRYTYTQLALVLCILKHWVLNENCVKLCDGTFKGIYAQ